MSLKKRYGRETQEASERREKVFGVTGCRFGHLRRGSHAQDREDEFEQERESSGDASTNRAHGHAAPEQSNRVLLHGLVRQAESTRYA